MSLEDRRRWEDKHRSRQSCGHTSGEPLASMAWLPSASAGRAVALDLACGGGRHLAPLCRAGYRVVAADIALPALSEVAQGHAASLVWPVEVDFDDWPFASDAFDLIVQCDFLDRALFSQLRDSLRPGGFLLVDTFCRTSAAVRSGPRNPAFRLAPGELEQRFSDWEIVRTNGGAAGAERAAILVRKPA